MEGKEAEKDCCKMKEDWQEGLCLIFIFSCGELCERHKIIRYSWMIWNLCLIFWCDKSHKHWFQSFLWWHYQQIPPTAFFIQSPIVHLSEREFLCVLSNFHVVRFLVFSYLQFYALVIHIVFKKENSKQYRLLCLLQRIRAVGPYQYSNILHKVNTPFHMPLIQMHFMRVNSKHWITLVEIHKTSNYRELQKNNYAVVWWKPVFNWEEKFYQKSMWKAKYCALEKKAFYKTS